MYRDATVVHGAVDAPTVGNQDRVICFKVFNMFVYILYVFYIRFYKFLIYFHSVGFLFVFICLFFYFVL